MKIMSEHIPTNYTVGVDDDNYGMVYVIDWDIEALGHNPAIEQEEIHEIEHQLRERVELALRLTRDMPTEYLRLKASYVKGDD